MRTLILLLLVAGVCHAQTFSEDFENRVNRSRLQQDFNWTFSGMTINKNVAITDSAIVSSPLTASRSTATGWLYIDGNKTVSFKSRVANLVAGASLVVRLHSLTGSATTRMSYTYLNTNIQNHSITTGNVQGWYRIEFFWPSVGGGNCLAALDDITSDIPAAQSTFLADLSVALTTDKPSYIEGEDVLYTASVGNTAGPNAAQIATVAVNIPNPDLINSISTTNCSFNAATQTISISNLAMNGTATVTFKSVAKAGNYGASVSSVTRMVDYNSANDMVANSLDVALPLPVTLTSFTASPGAEGNQLAWQTASEKNSDYFAIERGVVSDGRVQFEEIGRQRAAGNTALKQHYTFLDATATKATVHYRLRMVDRDGSTEYSPIITVAAEKEPVRFLAYPNPSRDHVSLQASQLLEEGLTVQVVTATGAQVQLHEFAAGQPLRLSLAELPAGVYRVLVAGATTTQALTVTKW